MNDASFSNQTAFLRKIRAALKKPEAGGNPFRDVFPDSAGRTALLLEKIRSRTAGDRRRLLERLMGEAPPLNLQVVPVPTAEGAAEAIVRLVKDRSPEWGGPKTLVAWRHPLIDGLNLPERLKGQGAAVTFPEADDADGFRRQAQSAMIGVTAADCCIAESATLVLKTRIGRPRMVSLLPSIHVAVIAIDQILESLGECYALVRQDPQADERGLTCCMTCISGPSKTADIEAVMVHGVHGPREMFIYVICGDG